MDFLAQKLIFIYACAVWVSDLGAMKTEWPPSPERIQQEMSKPYVKAGIQEVQQEVAREMWALPGSNRTELINLYVHSIGFQAVIGQMQENLGLTDDMIVAYVQKILSNVHKIDETTKDKWMPIVNFVYPRLSQLMLAKARIYTDNDFDTLVGIVSIIHEAYVKAIARSERITLEKPTDIVNKQFQLLEEIDNRIGVIARALGFSLSMREIGLGKLTGFITTELFGFRQVLKEYPIHTSFETVSSSYDCLIAGLSSAPQIMGKTLSEKLPTSLRNKLKKVVIAARDRHKAI